MRILLIGGGGREHALCWKLAQSPQVKEIFTFPGNPGTAQVPKNRNVPFSTTDLQSLLAFASTEGVDLTVVGPEQPLADGVTDLFRERDLHIFGPSKAAAQLEASKQFSKDILAENGIPTAAYETLRSESEALSYLQKASYPLVLKADGLAAGKGVSVCQTPKDAKAFVSNVMGKRCFGDAGATVVAEEFLRGEEASFLVIADGTTYVPLVGAQDHKRLLDGEKGPNTGGMGVYSPAPVFDTTTQKMAEEKVVVPLLKAMADRGTPFTGVLYVGLMLTKEGPKVLEFNVRFGDPEAQVILPRLESDLAELLYAAVRGRLKSTSLRWSNNAALGVVVASPGYPTAPKYGAKITGLDEASEDALLFHAGTKQNGNVLETSGGRVMTVTALAPTLQEAAQKAYRAVEKIQYDGKTYRKDIGWRALG